MAHVMLPDPTKRGEPWLRFLSGATEPERAQWKLERIIQTLPAHWLHVRMCTIDAIQSITQETVLGCLSLKHE
eukprot:1156313-Pelagomonas_calceolata.AAC.1